MQPFVYRKAAGAKNSRDVVAIGLQDEIELLHQKVANLETFLQTELGLSSDLRDQELFFKT
jgi:hypothetical protein